MVDSIEERLNVEGFRLGGSLTADADAWSIWQDNCLDAESQLAHSEALVLGRSYLMVWGDDDGDTRASRSSRPARSSWPTREATVDGAPRR